MHFKILLRTGYFVLVAIILAACGHPAAGPVKTEVLPADGGEVGKAFVEYVNAVARGDKTQIAKLSLSEPKNSDADYFKFLLSNDHAFGGRQQGDYATLFLQAAVSEKENGVATWNAMRTNGVWQFETPWNAIPLSYSPKPFHDCATYLQFPCAVITAPDSVVTGTVVLHAYDTDVYEKAPEFSMLDGFAVRMVGENKESMGTRIYLSAMGIIPETLTNYQTDADSIRYQLRGPLLDLTLGADGKTAKATLWNKNEEKKADVQGGVTIESNDGKRIRGRVKTDIKDVMAIDVYFDLAVASWYQP
jgi:hypothetical protein